MSRRIFHLATAGGDSHRYTIHLAAEVAASKGYKVHDMTVWTDSPHRPDLVISKKDKLRIGSRIKHVTVTYWVEVVDTHDPNREWVKPPCDDVLKIPIGGLTLDEIVDVLWGKIP